MPTYRFKCGECGDYQEKHFTMATSPAVITSHCCAAYAHRVPYPVKTTFKHNDGSAWKGGRKLSAPVRPRGVG